MGFNILGQLFGMKTAAAIAGYESAAAALKRRDYAGFLAALPADVKRELFAFVVKAATGGK